MVPGVTSVSAAAAAAGMPLVRHEDVLTVLPGTLPTPELARRLADTQGAAIMKLGRTFPAVREALAQAGRLDDALYVERASSERQSVMPVVDVDPAAVPYFSIVDRARAGDGGAVTSARPTASRDGRSVGGPAELLVVGLGPGPDRLDHPGGDRGPCAVQHVVGYAPYVNRVPQREGLQRHASGNTVEADRARFALDLAPGRGAGRGGLRRRCGRVRHGVRGVRGGGGPAVCARCRSGCCPGLPRRRRSRPGPVRRWAATSR